MPKPAPPVRACPVPAYPGTAYLSPARTFRLAMGAFALLALPACAAGPYTGPVQVTRFVAAQAASLGEGSVLLTFPDEVENESARNAFASAVGDALRRQGYNVVMEGDSADQIAAIRTSRTGVEAEDSRGPVSVGVGAGGGTFGGGAGLGVGIDLGGGDRSPRVITDLSVRISARSGETLWEARAQLPTSINSPYAAVDVSARTLAAALFRDFPGGNGETVTLDVNEIQGNP